jgi:CTP synthase
MVTNPILYEVPLVLEKSGFADLALHRLGLEARKKPDWSLWEGLVSKIAQPNKPRVKIALVGKYVELHDAYLSVREALKHAALHVGVELEINWIHAVDLEKGRSLDLLTEANGVLVPGGFGSRGIEGKILAARHARTHQVPYLGLCLGMQLLVVDFARWAFNDENANSTEFDRSTTHPVIDLMLDQQSVTDMGGTMRLGLYPCDLQPGTLAQAAYAVERVEERHRHRFELNNHYREALEEKGLVFSGLSPDGLLVEIAEIKDHPFMLGTQFHPEFLSRPERPHPLFMGFVQAVCKRAGVC